MRKDVEEHQSWGRVPLNSVQHRIMFDGRDDNPVKIKERKIIRELYKSITGMCRDQIRRTKSGSSDF